MYNTFIEYNTNYELEPTVKKIKNTVDIVFSEYSVSGMYIIEVDGGTYVVTSALENKKDVLLCTFIPTVIK